MIFFAPQDVGAVAVYTDQGEIWHGRALAHAKVKAGWYTSP